MSSSNHVREAGGPLYLGLDIGSVNARIAIVDKSGGLIFVDKERITKGPSTGVAALLKRAQEAVRLEDIAGAGVCGS
ncbi:MAG: hypothetical protein ACYC1C_06345, partial [Chloroflexota bacterium]